MKANKLWKTIGYLLILVMSTTILHATNWVAATSLNKARYGTVNIQLNDNRILSIGGRLTASGNATDYVEIYDPTTTAWTATGRMNTARMFFDAVKLSDGKVLAISGGNVDFSALTATCEVYDPSTGLWTSTGSVNVARYHQGSFLMPSGKVLIAGGQNFGGTFLQTAELWDPTTGLWTSTTSLNNARASSFSAMTGDGRALMISGRFPATPNAEVFAGTWTTIALPALTGSPTLWDYWETNSAVQLSNGNVFAAGGQTSAGSGVAHYAVLFDQTLNSFTSKTDLPMDLGMINMWRMSDGKVLLAGGHLSSGGTSSSTWVYDPDLDSWTRHGYMLSKTEQPSLMAPNTFISGIPVVVGGYDGTNPIATVEYFGTLPATTSSTADDSSQDLFFMEQPGQY